MPSFELLLPHLVPIINVLLVDIVMSADNAIVIALAVRNLPPEQKRLATAVGIGLAAAMRLGFSLIAIYLLQIPGLKFVGGLLLLVVVVKFAHSLITPHPEESHVAVKDTLKGAIFAIVLADVSMSLDNVLAVAAIAKESIGVLVFGLVLSIILMAVASTFIARIMKKQPWIAWLGLAVLAYVTGDLLWHGGLEVWGMLPR